MQIGDQNKRSPFEIYKILKGQPGAAEVGPLRFNQAGRKTLQELAQAMDLGIQDLLTALQDKGVEADPDDRVRDVAQQLGLKPASWLK